MRYQLVRELSAESLRVKAAAGDEYLFDKVNLKANLKENFRFELHNEIRQLAQKTAEVNHESLIKYQGLERHEAQFYLIRNNGEQEGLTDFRPNAPEVAIRVLRQALAVMQAYHQQGLVMGGLSLGQLKTNSRGDLLLQDPPVLNHLSQLLLGEYDFSLPAEVVKGNAWTARSDVFAWGEFAYKLLTGHDPFAAAKPEDRSAKILEGVVTEPRVLEPRLSEQLSQFILSCLAVELKQRPAPEKLVTEFEALVQQGKCLATPEEVQLYQTKSAAYRKQQQSKERLWLWWRKNRVVVTIIAVIGMFLGSLFLSPKHSRVTEKTTPLEVVNYYFEGIRTVDVSLMDDTVHKAKDSLAEIVGNIHVINATRKAGQFGTEDTAIKIEFDRFKLVKERETKTAVDFRATYTLKFTTANEINYLARADRFHVGPVGKKWQITKITNLTQKRWTKKLAATEVPGAKTANP